MFRSTRKMLIILSVSGLAACGQDRQIGNHATVSFVGGKLAAPDAFPALVAFDHCGAAKIGPRLLLTAAHCVIDQAQFSFAQVLRPGAQVDLAVRGRKADLMTVTIEKAWIHASYAQELAAAHQAATLDPKVKKEMPKTKFDLVNDLAIVRIAEELPLPDLKLDARAITGTDKFTAAGWGHRQLPTWGTWVTGPTSDLHFQRVSVLSASAEKQTFGFRTQYDKYHEVALSMAPGDSGSPALRRAGDMPWGEWLIVGVNSYERSGSSSHVARVSAAAACIEKAIAAGDAGSATDGPTADRQLPVFCTRD